jgi:hypothetical protein
MSAFCSRCTPAEPSTQPNYFVCLMDYRSAGQEAIVDPTIDRAEVIARLKTREYKNVVWIHHIHDGLVEDVTLALIGEARGLVFA